MSPTSSIMNQLISQKQTTDLISTIRHSRTQTVDVIEHVNTQNHRYK